MSTLLLCPPRRLLLLSVAALALLSGAFPRAAAEEKSGKKETPGLLAAVGRRVEAEVGDLKVFYKHLHANPELSFAEVKTAGRLAEELKMLGFTVTTRVGGTGVVGVLTNG